MFKIEKQWKEFNIDLKTLNAEIKAIEPNFIASQSHRVLELWFSEEPSQESKNQIDAFYDNLTANSVVATSYRAMSDITAAIKSLREGLIVKTWDQMNALERKLVMNIEITKEDLIAAELL